jgi:hypothetical protein
MRRREALRRAKQQKQEAKRKSRVRAAVKKLLPRDALHAIERAFKLGPFTPADPRPSPLGNAILRAVRRRRAVLAAKGRRKERPM